MAFDWLHLASVSAWVGGLPVLAWLLWSRSYSDVQPLQELIRQFSRLAILSVICLSLTGIYTSLRQVGTLEALLATRYGFTLLVKLGLFGILVALGAVNLLVLSPRLSRSESPVALHWLNRTVRIETFLSALVLVAAAGLSSTPPAREALQAQQRLGIVEGARANGVKLTLRVSPALAGDNELGVDIIDRRPGADQAPATVLYRFKMLDHEMGETQVEASSPNGLRYTARGSYLSMVGRWQVAVILRRSGMDDVRHDFELDIQSASPEVVGPPNPFPPTPDSIAAGQLLFQANCQPCHGPGGRGDGPVGLTLNPRPVDLTLHTVPGIHTDGQLFLWISDGYPGSQMPAFRSALSDEQRWHVVNFIRTLTGRPVP
jgi:putative copper resistance protein D